MDERESRDKEETEMLFDKVGNNFRKLPSLASSTVDKNEKREQLNKKKKAIKTKEI